MSCLKREKFENLILNSFKKKLWKLPKKKERKRERERERDCERGERQIKEMYMENENEEINI